MALVLRPPGYGAVWSLRVLLLLLLLLLLTWWWLVLLLGSRLALLLG